MAATDDSLAKKERSMKARALVLVVIGLILAHAGAAQQKQPAAPAANSGSTAPPAAPSAGTADLTKRVEAFLRNLYAWGSDFQLKVGPVGNAEVDSLYKVPVEVTANGQSDTADVYVTKDGHYIFRGDIQNLNADPLASTRRQLHLDGYASKGPTQAKVVLVEFADFECPSCRQLDTLLRQLLPSYPQVRLVFKDFPIEQIHPWAMTAAIAGHCVLQKSADAFWVFHDAVYDSQDLISADNAYSKLSDIAAMAGVDPVAFSACMIAPDSRAFIEKSVEEGRNLKINSTPTTYVDGREVVGADASSVQQFIDYDLASQENP
jgi:protein-disulfide isomerase